MTPIFDLTPCATCGHASAIHQIGSVCGAMHCRCRAFTPEPTDEAIDAERVLRECEPVGRDA